MASATEAELGGFLKTTRKRHPKGRTYQRWATNHQHRWQRKIQRQTA